MSERSHSDSHLVQFSERLTNSTAFSNLFREGMDLVEETAAYLDGAGRVEAKVLDRAVSLTYATESMRLTTRLMQLASWLLLHRAVKGGGWDRGQGHPRKAKVQAVAGRPGPYRYARKAAAAIAGADRPLDEPAGAGAPARQFHPRHTRRARCDRQSPGTAAQRAKGG